MATLFDDASLVMLPSGYKDDKLYSIKPTDGSGDFTFSRDGSGASPATRVNSAGIIEKGRTNLLLQSNQFDTTWTTSAVSLTSGQAGYDGTNDAWLLESTGANAQVRQFYTGITDVVTYSIYAKVGSVDWIRMNLSGAGNEYFDIANGVVGVGGSNSLMPTITSVGGGWYRCTITNVTGNSQNSVYVFTATADGSLSTSAGDNVYIQDAQLEKGLVATNYIATTTAAASAGILGDMPRLDYSGGATCPSLLLEPARTNAVSQSEYLNAVWGKTSVSVTTNAAVSPEGVQNAAKLVEANASSFHFLSFGTTINAEPTTFSFYAKAAERTSVSAFLSQSGNVGAEFDLSAETATATGTGNTASIESVGNGWYRCVVINNGSADLNNSVRIGIQNGALNSYQGDGTSGVYIWGAQLEINASYPTSYIPTHGSATARGGDDMNDSTFTALPNASLTIFFEVGDWAGSEGNNYQLRFIDSSGNRQIQFRNRPEGWRWLVVNDAGSAAYLHTANYTYRKMAVRYNGTNYQLFANGSAVGSAFAANDAGVLDTFQSFSIGVMGVKQMLCFPTALTDAECIALTTL